MDGKSTNCAAVRYRRIRPSACRKAKGFNVPFRRLRPKRPSVLSAEMAGQVVNPLVKIVCLPAPDRLVSRLPPLQTPIFHAIIPASSSELSGDDEDKRPMNSDSQRGRQEPPRSLLQAVRIGCGKFPSELFPRTFFPVRGNGQAPLQAKSASALGPVRNLGGNTRRSGLVP